MLRRGKGFTLIELLVVISIISLLSSIILATVRDARDKAVVARSLQFDTSVRSALSESMVGEYLFDDASNLLLDSSGLGNNAISSGGASYSAEGVIRGAADFRSTHTGIRIPQIIPLSGPFTISLWFNTTDTSYQEMVTSFAGGNGRFTITYDVSTGQIFMGQSGGNILLSKTVKLGVWNHMLVSKNASNVVTLYVNGEKIGTGTATTNIENTNQFIGYSAANNSSRRNKGLVDNVRIYTAALE